MVHFHLIKSYIKFLWNSKNEHGVHSPFVFNLITRCFYDRKSKPEYKVLQEYRNSLLANKYFIEVTDFGSGSKVFKSNKRQISKIVKTAGISKKRAQLLFRIVSYFQSESNTDVQHKDNILEIGTSLGLATSALSLGNKKAQITTLEGCTNTASISKKQFQKFHLNNVEFVVTEFSNYFKSPSLSTINYELIYFDGNHSKQATLDYFKCLLPTTNNNSVWIFDDIHWSTDMEEAWQIIKNHSSVTVTIDTFRWGILFFRKEQVKEHFVIRV
jgi:Methyltransferase domain